MVERLYVPDTGDIVWLTFTPQAGHEQAGRRPALVLSPRSYNEKSQSGALLPHHIQASKATPSRSPFPLRAPSLESSLPTRLKSLDWRARRIRFASQVPSRVLGEVLAKLAVLLDQGSS